MSDDFFKVATQEINNELSGIAEILTSCQNDFDVFKNSDKIEIHMHKIKGLAPMIGKENLAELAKNLEEILKKIVSGKKADGFFHPLLNSIDQMKKNMDESCDLEPIQKQISEIALKLANS